MRHLESANWIDQNYKMSLLLFAETMVESLDELTYDSYQIPTLNIHTFCHDFLSTLQFYEEGVLQEGNMIPLVEEFEFYCKKDYITQKIIGEDSCFTLRKTLSGHFEPITGNIEFKARIKIYKRQVELLRNKIVSFKEGFIGFLFKELESVMFSKDMCDNPLDVTCFDNRKKIYYLTRTLGVELLTKYHRTFIDRTVKKFFFNKRTIHNCRRTWRAFKKELLGEKTKYSVMIGTNEDLYKVLSEALNGVNRKATKREKIILKLPYVHIYKVEARDPYSACEFMREFCNAITNVIKCEQHDVCFEMSDIIKCKKENSKRNQYSFQTQDFIKKRRNKSYEVAHTTYSFFFKNVERIPNVLYNALELHATAIRGSDVTNQLLNFWTILEALVKVDRFSFGSKCEQICNSIISILNINYLYSLLLTFYSDLKAANIDIQPILDIYTDCKSDVEKLLVSLSDNNTKEQFYKLLQNDPLLLLRYENLNSYFSAQTTETMYNILSSHSNRLRWHIMRIYRNRNLIVHQGDNMPYLSSIVDNLHFYVDMTLDFIWKKLFDGYLNIDAIFSFASSLEAKRLVLLGCDFNKNGTTTKNSFKTLDKTLLKQVVIQNSFVR